ncbi:hypothetical protein [Streptomyces sp. NPDC017673]|uniref:hypothetical protein n=1 Tax=unclassified Streptomyces TaxID=2593676 RepID=UPI0037947D8A
MCSAVPRTPSTRPAPAELAALLPPARTAAAPVRRGDLPSYGDGASDSSVDEGG